MTRGRITIAVLIIALATFLPRGATAATLEATTVAAWNEYVAAAEARISRELATSRGSLRTDLTSASTSIDVPGGLIVHGRGSVFVPGVTLETLLHRLQHPPQQGPHQEDVLALRVLSRSPDHLNLYIRMTRTKVVTVTYDTEHSVDYRRSTPQRASSRSVSTRIVELDDAGTPREVARPEGRDRGFLWRLNSYWRYEQVPGGVVIEMESLTLSRSIPLGLGVVVSPIIDRIARESMSRTLQTLRVTHAQAPGVRAEARQ
ncbi:MAG: hypothetical protein ABL986_10650 [Vicinamibacterales bacterium]